MNHGEVLLVCDGLTTSMVVEVEFAPERAADLTWDRAAAQNRRRTGPSRHGSLACWRERKSAMRSVAQASAAKHMTSLTKGGFLPASNVLRHEVNPGIRAWRATVGDTSVR